MAIKGSLKLNMKRDDARTLMLKMDARLTYAGRERYAGFKLEGERQLRHIEVTHKLMNAELNRERNNIQRRSEYYQMLIDNNKERKQKRGTAWCEEEEKEWERQARAARRRRKLPKIEPRKNHKAEAINSVRRELKRGFANKMTHEMHMNRSLDELNDSIAKHKMFEKRNELIKLSPITGTKAETDNTEVEEEAKEVTDKPTIVPIVLNEGHGKLTKATHKVLPDIAVDKKDEQPSRPTADPPTGTGRSFYMNTGTEQHPPAGGNLPEISALSMLQKMRRKGVLAINPTENKRREGPSTNPKGPSQTDPKKTKTPRTSLMNTGPKQEIPLRFYEPEHNPFLKGFKLPEINRSSALKEADKADEMFEWLGFESKEELDTLRGEIMRVEDGDDACSESSSVEENKD